MTGPQFERHVRALLESRAWHVDVTPASHGGGIDFVARKRGDVVDIESVLYIQCKNCAAPVGADRVRALNGALPRHAPGALGMLVCPSGFTRDAAAFANERGILVWGRADLAALEAHG